MRSRNTVTVGEPAVGYNLSLFIFIKKKLILLYKYKNIYIKRDLLNWYSICFTHRISIGSSPISLKYRYIILYIIYTIEIIDSNYLFKKKVRVLYLLFRASRYNEKLDSTHPCPWKVRVLYLLF